MKKIDAFALAALIVAAFTALTGVSRADFMGSWYINGNQTQTWTSTSGGDGKGLRTVTGQLCPGYSTPGTLNQDAGTITVANPTWETIIGQYANGTYNMSGTASLVQTVKAVWLGNNANGTWTLTDHANASIAALNFGNGGDGYANHLLLSGSATFSATDLVSLAGANEYISFASGSMATLTVANKTLSDYQTLVSGGFIRVDGAKQSDFSKFQVTGTGGHTLSLPAVANATHSTVTASPATVANDGVSTSTITVTLLTVGDVRIPGRTVALASSRGTTDTISAASGPSDSNGVVTFTVKSTTTGSAVFTATDTTDGVVVTQTATVSFAAGVPHPANSTVTASPSSVPANGVATSTITATLLTHGNAPVSGRTVTLASNRGAADTISAASGPSDTNGVVTFTVKSSMAGAAIFTATDTSDGMVVTQTATVSFTVGAVTATNSTVTAAPGTVVADGVTASTISVTMKDIFNNPVPGKTVTLASSRGTTDTISPASGPSSAAGLVTFSVTTVTYGSAVFTATDVTNGNLVLTPTAAVVFLYHGIILDDADSGRVFEGIGAVSAGASTRNLADYPAKQKSEILDYMFKPKFGASLQHLKVEIGGGENSTCGSEPTHALTRAELTSPKPRGYEFWLMAEARKRNPKVILDCLPWSYPYWVPDRWSQEAADWFVAFLDCAKNHYGLKMDWVGGEQNELGYDLNWIVNTLRPTMDAHGYADVKLQGPELAGSYWMIFDSLVSNPAADNVIKAVSYHYPNSGDGQAGQATQQAIASGKPLWDSEEFTVSGKSWGNALYWAQLLNKNYILNRITKTEMWSLLSGIYPGIAYSGTGLMQAHTPWSGYYEVWPAVWTTAHTTQFADPGWRYMDHACAQFDPANWAGSCVTLRNPATGDWSMIVCTNGPKNLQVQVAGKLSKGDVHVWKSNGQIQFEEQSLIHPTHNTFSVSLEGNSIYTLTTTTGQKKGAHPVPPPAGDFPLPYKDDFESYPAGVTPKYTSDQKGTIETAKRADGKGICLRQIVSKEGITWGGAGGVGVFPNTVFGDSSWTNYTLQVDVLIVGGKAGIGGRYAHSVIRGWNFAVQQNGTWSLEVPNRTNGQDIVRVLATGKVEGFTPGRWHHLALTLKGAEVCASLDGNELARAQNEGYPDHKSGMAYLMSSYDPNCFDNISVTP
ncbi:MAG: Ig-like domain-containing protein [Verrucomicrobia bacterium]|nr:Ig-like domain-containing protein [Verrucomicrobiota bacterium]